MTTTRIFRIALVAFLVMTVFAGSLLVDSASAQTGSDPVISKCLVCHEDLYYQHDTGKSFCMCEDSMTCACCHGGDDQAVDIETAHANMTLQPITDDVMVCQKCHPDNFQEKAKRFVSIAGITTPVPEIIVTEMPAGAVVPISPDLGLFLKESSPWQITLLVLVCCLFLAVLVFGYRCWRMDCLSKQTDR